MVLAVIFCQEIIIICLLSIMEKPTRQLFRLGPLQAKVFSPFSVKIPNEVESLGPHGPRFAIWFDILLTMGLWSSFGWGRFKM